jgi:uncharacterized protein (TIGR03000 family)
MMRKMLLVLSLAGLAVLASASDAFAQRRWSGGGWGYTPGFSFGVGRGGYYSPYGYYGGRGYSPSYQGYGYSYGPSSYYATPSYYYATPTYSVMPATSYSEPASLVPTMQIRQAYYTAPATAQQSASLTVLVPASDAKVWFENRATTQQGMERMFESPPLEPNQNFTYTIKVLWIDKGQAVNQERRVNVQAGQSITVNFRENTRENVPPPLPDAIRR